MYIQKDFLLLQPRLARKLLALVSLRRKYNIVLQIKRRCLITLESLEVNNQIVLDSKHGISLQPGVIRGVQLCCAALKFGMSDLNSVNFKSNLSWNGKTYHNVNMSRPHRMPIHQTQKSIRRPIRGQTVSRRMIAVEPVLAILIRPELAAKVVGSLVLGVLKVVFAIGASLPDIKDSTRNGLAGQEIGDSSVHLADTTGGVRIHDDAAAVLTERGVGRPEGAEDGGGGGIDVALGNDLVCDLIHKAVHVRYIVGIKL